MSGTGIGQPAESARMAGRAVISLFALLHFAAATHAGANLFLTPVADPPTTPFTIDTGLNSPPYSHDWVSYVLGVATDDGSKIQAVEVNLQGVFHQRWNWDSDALSYPPTPVNANTSSGDSHFLVPPSAFFGIAPYENNNIVATPNSLPDVVESRDYGVGTIMQGVWAFSGTAGISTMANLAYLVIPRGSESQLAYRIKGANSLGNILFDLQHGTVPPLPVVPPPPPPPPPPGPPIPLPPKPLPGGGVGVLIGTATLVKSPMMGIPFTAPDGALGPEWVSYKLEIQTTDGSLIQAVEANITGPLHQRWTDSDADEVFEPTANSFAASGLTNGDSHLLAPAGALFGNGPSEDNSGIGSTLSDTAIADYGLGSFLHGAWGIPQALSSANVAYIVIPKGSESLLNVRIKAAGPAGNILGTVTFPSSLIPEPSCLLLAGWALIGCLSRWRVR